MRTVLIVDDHPAFRAAARALLEADGFTVVGEAVDGESAIGAVALLDPELVLLDIQLPDTDGFTIAERLMTGPEPRPAVVLVSTRTASSYRQRLAASPALGFIGKSELSASSLLTLLAS